MAARFEVWVCGSSHVGVAGSNPTGDMDLCCQVKKSLRRADHSFRGVLPSLVCLSAIAKPCKWWRFDPESGRIATGIEMNTLAAFAKGLLLEFSYNICKCILTH